MVGFWRQQFATDRTPAQILFDLFFGIVVPLLCVWADPVMFKRTALAGPGELFSYRFFAYTEIAVAVTALAAFLSTNRPSLWMSGFLSAAAVFSVGLAIKILPLALMALLIVIGAQGLTPWFSAAVFFRNSVRSVRALSVRQKGVPAMQIALISLLVLGIPMALQLFGNRVLDRAVQ